MPTLAASTISQLSSHRTDEEFINKSLLDSLDAQADAEPISSSDSEHAAPASYGSASNSSGGGSPSVPYHISMQSLVRSDSPGVDSHNLHMPSQDPIYHHQNGMYSDNTMNVLPEYGSDSDSRKLQQQHQHKLESFPGGYRGTFGTFPNPTRSRPQIARSDVQSSTSYRDAASFYPTTAADVFSSHLTSPVQSHTQAFDSRASYDFGGGQGSINGKPFNDLYNPSARIMQAQTNSSKHQHQQPAQHGSYPAPYTGGLHLSSQTPYGPHVPAGPPSTGTNTVVGPIAPPGLVPASNPAGTNANSEEISTIFVVGFPEDMQEREFQNMFTFSPGFEAATLKIPNKEYTAYSGVIGNTGLRSTINNTFGSYGGPNDPYNLVTVNQGGVVVDAGRDGTMTSWPATVPGDDVGGSHFLGGSLGGTGAAMNMPRKQIIGFAKFRTREEALCARDVLQGRRVDIDKGAVLKAEMAKKNLHTKRGVGPVPGGATGAGTSGPSGGGGAGGAANQGGMQQVSGMNGVGLGMGGPDPYSIPSGNNESAGSRERELGTLGAMGLGSGRLNQWRDQIQQPQDHIPVSSSSGLLNGRMTPGREQEDDRRAGVMSGMGLVGLGSGTRGPRERLEDDDRERRRKEKEMMRLRAGNSTAFDAFHSVPIGSTARHMSNSAGGGLLSPVENVFGNGISPMIGNGYGSSQPQVSAVQHHYEEVGPWDNVRSHRPRSSSRRSDSPSNLNAASSYLDQGSQHFASSQHLQHLDQMHQEQQRHDHRPIGHPPHSESSSSSVADDSQRGGGESDGSGVDGDMSLALGGLEVSTDGGKTSPQLPSPASGASSRNGVDQNPPINTLYVGNLPTSPPPTGFPQDYLEESLRELFSSQTGFRRLCFRQKSNGPMCFVEFDDVQFATRALNDLYGNTLKGLVKGGIRLSYSKNPLGVRTPTSASSNSSLQQQLMNNNTNTANGNASYPSTSALEFHPRLTEDQQSRTVNILRRETSVTSPTLAPMAPFGNNFLASPPPRFFSSSPSATTSFGPSSGSTQLTGTSNAFMPRSSGAMNMNMFGYSLPTSANSNLPSSTFSPFGSSSTPPPHAMIPEISDDQPHSQHFVHRALSPPTNNLEAARAS